MHYGWLISGGIAAAAVAAYFGLASDDRTQDQASLTAGPTVSEPADGPAADLVGEPADSAAAGGTQEAAAELEASSAAQSADLALETTEQSDAALSDAAADASAANRATPSFDAVRVGESGIVVAAGRAEPLAEITVMDGTEVLGQTTADAAGDWVFVTDHTLGPGTHELGLQMERAGGGAEGADGEQAGDGVPVLSENIVVLVVPEAQQDIAGRPATAEEQVAALALLVPRGEGGPTTVLQAPLVEPGAGPEGAASIGEGGERLAETDTADGDLSVGSAPGGGVPDAIPERIARVQIDVVDYDQEGQVMIAGQADPGAALRLYVDDTLAGSATTGEDGVYRFQPQDSIAPGLYRLRVDQVDDTTGATVARAETPFQREAVVPPLPAHGQIVVQPGHSLWRIARNIYGHGVQYTVIYQANTAQIRDPDLIYPGQIFTVPGVPTGVPSGVPTADPT